MLQSVRLNKWLALQLGISRREADELIAKGKISINGSTAALGAQITPGSEIIKNDNVLITTRATLRYIALNKPTGYVCSRKRQGSNPTIYGLLPDEYHDLKPVGRLDKDSSGLILLTNDGDFAHHMTHPSYYKTKIYEVMLDKSLEPLHQQMISDYGVTLEDGVSKFELERLDDTRMSWRITMSEGRNRQIRRTFASLGYSVLKLHRNTFGSYHLGSLKKGAFQVVTRGQV